MVNHQVYHKRKIHNDICLYFVEDMIESNEIRVKKIALEDNMKNVFTKSLSKSRSNN